MRTYWIQYPQNFSNQYTVGIATTEAHATQYEAEGYDRIDRAAALRRLCYRGDWATTAYVSATLDGRDFDRFTVARRIRAGELLERDST